MDAGDLRIFEAVARLGGMNRAAAELNTVQSNVTTRIQLLEEDLGTPLFHRHSRGVALTPAGRRLLPYAERVRHVLDEARRAVEDDGTPRGPLTIGSLESTAALRLSPVLARYAEANPKVDLVLTTGTSCELIEAVLERRVEGAFVVGPVDNPELVEEKIVREELVVLTAPSVRRFEDVIRSGDVRIVVLRAGCSYRQRLEELLVKRGVPSPRRLEFGTLEALFGCVAAGLGVTLLPKALIGRVWQEGKVAMHTLPPAEARADTVFIRRSDGYVSSALTAFLAEVRPTAVQTEAAD
jgi:DNA-binding transcriptional LysR family regulator